LETIRPNCLEKEADARPESAQYLVAELDRYSDGVPILSRKPSRLERLQKRCVRRAESAATVMALMIITSGGVLLAVNGFPQLIRSIEGKRRNQFADRDMSCRTGWQGDSHQP